MGCHALLQGIFQPRDGTQVFHISCIAGGFFMIRQQGSPQTSNVSVLCLATQLCLTLCNPMNSSPPGSFVCGDSPGNNTGVGCHGLLQWIFPTQESNRGLPHCRQIPKPVVQPPYSRLIPIGGFPTHNTHFNSLLNSASFFLHSLTI